MAGAAGGLRLPPLEDPPPAGGRTLSPLLAAALAVAAFWTVQALFTTVNLLVFRRPPRRSAPGPGEAPAVSLVIPARDEERSLAATLEAALAQEWPRLQVVVVDDESADATPRILAAHAAADRRLVPVAGRPPPAGWLGKPHALAQGAAEADGDWLLFLDADVRLHRHAVASAMGWAEERRLDHLALFPRFERRGFWEHLLMPSLALSFWTFFPSFLSRWRRLRGLAFGSGSFNLVRAAAYRRIGGHERLRDSVVDDIRLAVELKKAGHRSTIEVGDRLASIRMYHGRREIFAGFEKNVHALIARHPWFSLFNLTLGTLMNLAPFAWPLLWWVAPEVAAGPAGWTLLTALGLALVCRGAVHTYLRYPLWPVVLHPLSVVAGCWIAGRSLAAAYGEGVVRWRGREYRREETGF